MASIGVIGSGTWGTALAVLLHGNGHQVVIWSAIPEEIKELKATHAHRNLPEVEIPEAIGFTDDLEEAMEDKDAGMNGEADETGDNETLSMTFTCFMLELKNADETKNAEEPRL